jgi:hypothetical protein
MWKWVLLAAAVLYYMAQREKSAIPISANRAASSTITKAGNAVGTIIDETAPAVGRWLSGLFSGSSSSSSSSSSASSGANTKPDWVFWDDV